MASRGAWTGFLAVMVGSMVAAACGNNSGISTDATPTPAGSGTPTPTPNPTGTPGSGAVTFALTPNPATPQSCEVGQVQESWAANFVVVTITSNTFTPNWGQAASTYLVAPNGTLSGNNFSASWTYCQYDALSGLTTKHAWTWTGTLAAADASFTSTISETLTNATGDLTATCASVTQSMSDCTSPGLSWSLSGVKQ